MWSECLFGLIEESGAVTAAVAVAVRPVAVYAFFAVSWIHAVCLLVLFCFNASRRERRSSLQTLRASTLWIWILVCFSIGRRGKVVYWEMFFASVEVQPSVALVCAGFVLCLQAWRRETNFCVSLPP